MGVMGLITYPVVMYFDDWSSSNKKCFPIQADQNTSMWVNSRRC